MHQANERRRYIVTSSPIGWAHTQNDPGRAHLTVTFHMIRSVNNNNNYGSVNLKLIFARLSI